MGTQTVLGGCCAVCSSLLFDLGMAFSGLPFWGLKGI